MNDRRFEEIPMVLETVDDSIWADEIRTLYGLIGKG
jgi:deoxyribonuclease-4